MVTFGTLAGTTAAAVIILGGWTWFLLQRHRRTEAVLAKSAIQPVIYASAASDDEMVSPPPSVGGYAVRDWLLHYSEGSVTWSEVVSDFYARAAQDPEVFSYFHGVDMAQLQRHFTAAIAMVTSKGISGNTLLRMGRVHANVVDEQGRPITTQVYNKVAGALAEALSAAGVPQEAIQDLARLVDPLRSVIVPVDR